MSLFDMTLSEALMDMVMGLPFVLSRTVEPLDVVALFCFVRAITNTRSIAAMYFRQLYEKACIDSRRLCYSTFNRMLVSSLVFTTVSRLVNNYFS